MFSFLCNQPANIFLDSNDRVKIGDFGLATSRPAAGSIDQDERSARRGTISDGSTFGSLTKDCGTPSYMAPEMLIAEGLRKLITFYILDFIVYLIEGVNFKYRPLQRESRHVQPRNHLFRSVINTLHLEWREQQFSVNFVHQI